MGVEQRARFAGVARGARGVEAKTRRGREARVGASRLRSEGRGTSRARGDVRRSASVKGARPRVIALRRCDAPFFQKKTTRECFSSLAPSRTTRPPVDAPATASPCSASAPLCRACSRTSRDVRWTSSGRGPYAVLPRLPTIARKRATQPRKKRRFVGDSWVGG